MTCLEQGRWTSSRCFISLPSAFHTVIGIIAVVAGVVALVRNKEISPRSRAGQIYIVATIFTCLTGFFIFHHGGFGKGHALGIITLVVLGIAGMAGKTHVFGRASRYVETVGYSATFFFHMIPTITETSTRIPPSAPLASGPDVPGLQMATGVLLLLFLAGAFLQVRRLRAANR